MKCNKIRKQILLVFCLLLLAGGALPVSAAWKTTEEGKMYTKKSSPGYVTGWKTINGETYYFNASGIMMTGWLHDKGNYYYLGKNTGKLAKNKWVGSYYVGSDGARLFGLQKIGSYTYYLNPKTGKKMTGLITLDGQKYFFNKKGRMVTGGWASSNTYYASASGALISGMAAISGTLYFFDKTTYKKLTNIRVKVGSSFYFFGSSGAAARKKWVKIKSNYYYFQSNGKMAVDTVVDHYYVNEKGVRGDKVKTGWQTISGVKVYITDEGEIASGWQKIDGDTYYFLKDGQVLTGIGIISGKKYYFYPSGKLAMSITINVGSKQYTINASGVVTSEKSLKVSGSSTGVSIANYAVQFVGNPYVYGGTSLTNGADCSGFCYTIFAHFGISLLRVADDQMKGPSSSYISAGYTKIVASQYYTSKSEFEAFLQPGDLIFYGSGNYASHVGIYIGNGNIVHASNSQPYPAGGIKISAYNYQTPLRAVRYWS